MAKLQIVRRLEWYGAFRKVDIEIDGQVAGSIRALSSLNLEVPAGTHQIQGFMSWIGTPTLDIALDDGIITRIGVSMPYRGAVAATGASFPGGDQREYARNNPGMLIYVM